MVVWKKVIVHGLRAAIGPAFIYITVMGKKQMGRVCSINNKIWLPKGKGEQNLQL